MLERLINVLLQHGPIGMFLLAFISNSIPYSTIPYLVIIAPFIARYRGLDLLEAIISLAFGATAGKLIVYLLGKSLYRIPRVRAYLSGASVFFKSHSKSVFLTLFLVAALPLPDDIFYIPIGSSGYSIVYYFIAVLLGKMVIGILTAIYGVVAIYLLEGVIGFDPLISTPIMVILTILIILGLGKVDWLGVEEKYKSEGAIIALIYLAKSIAYAMIILPVLRFISLLRKHVYRR